MDAKKIHCTQQSPTGLSDMATRFGSITKKVVQFLFTVSKIILVNLIRWNAANGKQSEFPVFNYIKVVRFYIYYQRGVSSLEKNPTDRYHFADRMKKHRDHSYGKS